MLHLREGIEHQPAQRASQQEGAESLPLPFTCLRRFETSLFRTPLSKDTLARLPEGLHLNLLARGVLWAGPGRLRAGNQGQATPRQGVCQAKIPSLTGEAQDMGPT